MTHTMRVDARTGDEYTFVCDECGRVVILAPGTDRSYLVLIRGDETAGHKGSTTSDLSVSIEP